jgi:hypothetical protein
MDIKKSLIVALVTLNLTLIALNFLTTSFAIYIEEANPHETGAEIGCTSYYQNCRCFGILWSSFTNQNKYTCIGFNFCKDIRIGQCG